MRRLLGLLIVLLGVCALLVPTTADASVRSEKVSDYVVTFVARVCDEYPDIMANRARNNIQESLRDLGPDTLYSEGQSVSPQVEDVDAATQVAGCRPLPDWRLSLGTGITGKTPASLYLSTVTGAYGTSIVTKPTEDELDANANPTGRTLQGAVNVTLTAAQVERAQHSSQLWTQGGTPAAPLNNKEEEFGFGALRCSIDNLNGDNVEWIQFPPSTHRVYCYYFAVQPPPEAGTIIVRKQLSAGSSGPATFTYQGNISYTSDQTFQLQANTGAPGSLTFIRGETRTGEEPWEFTEHALAGWAPVGPPVCTKTGASTITIGGGGDPQAVSIALAAGDTVRCTYTNQPDRTGPLSLSKVTLGGTGSFPFHIDVPPGGTDIDTVAETTEDGVPVLVAQGNPGGPTGTYDATETLPADSPLGSWDLSDVSCDGTNVPFTSTGQDRSASFSVGLGEQSACLFTNAFEPGGSLRIRKTSLDGTGTFGYSIQQFDGDAHAFTGLQYFQQADTTGSEGVPVTASGDAATDAALSRLGVDTSQSFWVIREGLPPDSPAGRWHVVGLTCDGPTPIVRVASGFVVAEITSGQPDVTCSFTNRLVPWGTLDVTKNVSGDAAGRTGAVTLVLACDDGTKETLVVPVGEDQGSLPQLLFGSRSTCTLEETDTGVAADGTVDTAIGVTVDGRVTQDVDGRTATFHVRPGSAVAVTVLDLYTAGSGVLPTEESQLPATGAGGVGGSALLGVGLVGLGTLLLVAPSLRRRRH